MCRKQPRPRLQGKVPQGHLVPNPPSLLLPPLLGRPGALLNSPSRHILCEKQRRQTGRGRESGSSDTQRGQCLHDYRLGSTNDKIIMIKLAATIGSASLLRPLPLFLCSLFLPRLCSQAGLHDNTNSHNRQQLTFF